MISPKMAHKNKISQENADKTAKVHRKCFFKIDLTIFQAFIYNIVEPATKHRGMRAGERREI
jgi:hypothetical protein